MQDKIPPRRMSAGVRQPSTATTDPLDRPKHHGSEKRQTGLLSTRVPLPLRSAVLRHAEQHGWSVSKTVCVLLDTSMQHTLAEQYGTQLAAVLVDAVREHTHNAHTRTGNLALQAYYSAEQTRILTIHVLRFLMGDTIDELPLLITEAQKQAWANLKHQIADADPQDAPDEGKKERVPWQS